MKRERRNPTQEKERWAEVDNWGHKSSSHPKAAHFYSIPFYNKLRQLQCNSVAFTQNKVPLASLGLPPRCIKRKTGSDVRTHTQLECTYVVKLLYTFV